MPMFAQTPLPSVTEIETRLAEIFPEGVGDRKWVVSEIAARTVFALMYVDAVEGHDRQLSPVHVYRMGDPQSELQTEEQRTAYWAAINSKKYKPLLPRWMEDGSRESVRDDTLRNGLVPKGATFMDPKIPTTSDKPRHAIRADFARLFLVPKSSFSAAAAAWREIHLNANELTRVHLVNRGSAAVGNEVTVKLPNGEARNLPPGESSILTKAVVEEFARRFIQAPAVVWISSSRNKVIQQDADLMRSIKLPIDQARMLPDLVLAETAGRLRLFFIEIVATDGPFTDVRKAEVLALTKEGGYSDDQVVFISVFAHRGSPPLRSRLSALALDSYVWCAAEPDTIIGINAGRLTDCKQLLR